ncbi:hypothetical protein ALC56_11191, partial [Trachymyrmex septentrionalis]
THATELPIANDFCTYIVAFEDPGQHDSRRQLKRVTCQARVRKDKNRGEVCVLPIVRYHSGEHVEADREQVGAKRGENMKKSTERKREIDKENDIVRRGEEQKKRFQRLPATETPRNRRQHSGEDRRDRE